MEGYGSGEVSLTGAAGGWKGKGDTKGHEHTMDNL